jgi:hypothetical protein
LACVRRNCRQLVSLCRTGAGGTDIDLALPSPEGADWRRDAALHTVTAANAARAGPGLGARGG